MPLYLITTHPEREGVNLSKPGHWGGRPFPSAEAAQAAALEDANGKAEVRTETVRRKRGQG
jgi:hypothetical protein